MVDNSIFSKDQWRDLKRVIDEEKQEIRDYKDSGIYQVKYCSELGSLVERSSHDLRAGMDENWNSWDSNRKKPRRYLGKKVLEEKRTQRVIEKKDDKYHFSEDRLSRREMIALCRENYADAYELKYIGTQKTPCNFNDVYYEPEIPRYHITLYKRDSKKKRIPQ